MSYFEDLQPAELWAYFEEILAIPRISKNEEQIAAYLEDFAGREGLDFQRDQVGNLLISKPASQGMEQCKGIILQSHLDMVGEKNAHVRHDFSRDPITPVLDDGWVRARETTLGADDGVGIAASMAILASKELIHGPLECLFTVDEESGMTGALGLQPGFLKGEILLNLDSEDEGEVFIGCAGGLDTVAFLDIKKKRGGRTKKPIRLEVKGLRGGHSGDEIHKGLGNSIKILSRLLWNLDRKFSIQLASIEGGKARNAIPREAQAHMLIPANSLELIRVYLDSIAGIIRSEYALSDPDCRIELKECERPDWVFRKKQQRKLLNALYACPNGVVAMSQEIPELVETSTNLASLRMESGDRLTTVTSQRSSVESAKREIADRMAAHFTLMGAQVKHSDGYPGWKPNVNSEILGISKDVYQELFGRAARVKAIHAGLECGLFLQKYPALDMISFGPTIKGAHTPEEGMEIATVERFWKFLLKVLERAPSADPA